MIEPEKPPQAGRPGAEDIAREILEFRLRAAGAIQRRREAAGLTQVDFAARLGMTASYLARIENGRGVSLDRLMNAFFTSGAKLTDLARIKPADSPGNPGTPGA